LSVCCSISSILLFYSGTALFLCRSPARPCLAESILMFLSRISVLALRTPLVSSPLA
jgi:hypothetical protein